MTEPRVANRGERGRPRPAADGVRRRWRPLAAAMVALLGVVWWWNARANPAGGDGASPAAPRAASAVAARDSVVTLDSAAQRLAGVELVTVTSGGAGQLLANGAITFDANRVSVVAPRADGRVVSVRADLGHQVRSGAVLAILESPEVGQIRGDLERARAAVDVARRNYEREKRLYEQSISPQKEMLDAEVIYRTAEADVNSAAAKLRTYGATSGRGGTFGLTTPIAGTVVERNATPGQIVGPTAPLFTVADLRHLWITVDVYEADLPRVTTGAAVTIVPGALPAETFRGRVTYAGGVIDPASHTFKVRVEVENASARLRPGMFAQVRIDAPAASVERPDGAAAGVVVVPELALQDVDGRAVVFVASATPGRYVARPITTGTRAANGLVPVTSGLRAGERVVVKGAFQLKAELTKASFGDGEG